MSIDKKQKKASSWWYPCSISITKKSTTQKKERKKVIIELKTRVFEFSDSDREYKNLTKLAKAMGISASQVYRIRQGKRGISRTFIVGALQAFPESKFDDLFYIESKGG